ncbi:hypothetical protein [Pedobacter miscanthi]|jgi:hypothetical protein|uniref:hypothetical protein n=1 Tax=Pedobacter miscanthi TaxID=2259170 RepID=UPI002931726B|nr:hypothetical protein [Pedobacter miscanthi]
MKKILVVMMMCLMSVGAFASEIMVITKNEQSNLFMCRATIMQYDADGTHSCNYVAYGDTCAEAMANARALQAECE